MFTRTSAIALALGALLLLASGAGVRAGDEGSSKKPSMSLPARVYRGTVESVTRPRFPGMHTQVVIRTGWWSTVECWITPETELYWGGLSLLWLNPKKGDKVEAKIDEEGHALWIRSR